MEKKLIITVLSVFVALVVILSTVLIIFIPNSVISDSNTPSIDEDGIIDDNEPPDIETDTPSDLPNEPDIPTEDPIVPNEPPVVEPEKNYIEITNKDVQSLVSLNVRSSPSTYSTIVGSMQYGDVANCTKKYNSGWYEISYNNSSCFVSSNPSYTKLVDKNSTPSWSITADKIINEGKKLLGIPYEYGAQRLLYENGSFNPYFTGRTYDCSSFVQFAYYKGAGIKINVTSRLQSLQGYEVAHSQIRKGDLLFMTSSSREDNVGLERIGHVALYIGDNKILHTFGTGGVRIQDYSAFWRGRFILAKRFF